MCNDHMTPLESLHNEQSCYGCNNATGSEAWSAYMNIRSCKSRQIDEVISEATKGCCQIRNIGPDITIVTLLYISCVCYRTFNFMFQTADIAAAPLFATARRRMAVDFCVPFLDVKATVLISRETHEKYPHIKKWKDLAFQNQVWKIDEKYSMIMKKNFAHWECTRSDAWKPN